MTRRKLTDEQWKLIEPFLPMGEYGPYPERLREQFEGVIRGFRTSSQWREIRASSARGRRSTAASGSGGTPASSPRCWKA
ncbi:hypothetical protein GCM10010381_58190 [Streptomyces xantholiticus]|nr:hypothetical protein GCM10010381_58190 [Streptomyces xantholiticus]